MSTYPIVPMRQTLRHALACFAALTLLACGSGRPLPEDLAVLDAWMQGPVATQMRVAPVADEIDDPNLLDLRTQAHNLIRTASVFHQNALEAHGKRNADQTLMFTRVGRIYYSAAENYHRSAEARTRLMDANAEFEVQRQRRNDFRQQLGSEQELLALLETVQRLFQRNEELRRQLATFEETARSEARAIYSIQEARMMQREAEGMRANRYAAQDFDRATATLNRAQGLADSGEHENAYQAALEAIEQYRRAIENARPSFMADQDRILRNPGAAQLFEDTQRVFGPTNAFVDARGIVMVLPDLFENQTDRIKPTRTVLLDEAATLLAQHRNINITIEGHTSDEGRDEVNMQLSRTRAEIVRTYLSERGVQSRRVTINALGEDAPRFDNSSSEGQANNNRVEIVIAF
jgi:outer membrane protein OmpA-like peptidoglycan-associated protein